MLLGSDKTLKNYRLEKKEELPYWQPPEKQLQNFLSLHFT